MLLTTQTDVLARVFGDEKCIDMMAESGFDAIDWSFFGMEKGEGIFCTDAALFHAEKLRNYAESKGLKIVQAHAPFPSSRGTEPYDTEIRDRILRSMEVAARMGARNIVVHPRQHKQYMANHEEMKKATVELYRELLPYAQEWNIRICTENMWQFDTKRGYIVPSVCSSPEDFCEMIDTIDSPYLVGCLDIGHCALTGYDPAEFIRSMGKDRLQALHVHDVDYLHDCHTLPFTRNLDWEPITQALAEIGYEGNFTFEADNFIVSFPDGLKQQASILMAQTGRYLIKSIQQKMESR